MDCTLSRASEKNRACILSSHRTHGGEKSHRWAGSQLLFCAPFPSWVPPQSLWRSLTISDPRECVLCILSDAFSLWKAVPGVLGAESKWHLLTLLGPPLLTLTGDNISIMPQSQHPQEISLSKRDRSEYLGLSVLLVHRELQASRGPPGPVLLHHATCPYLEEPECSPLGKTSRDARGTPPLSAQFRASPSSLVYPINNN